MSLNADLLVDRRRLRRQVTFWRVLTIGIALAALIGGGMALMGRTGSAASPHIARIRIDGLITGKQETLDLIKRAEISSASALILRINSGGGTTSGSEALYRAVRKVAAKKPVVAVIDATGASGAYMTAVGADRIIANGSGLVGSIGVIAQYPNLTKMLDSLGVKVEAVRSSPLKALPNGIEPTSPEARAALEATVLDSYTWFRNLIGERRKLDTAQLDQVADGRVFTGRQALNLKLVDDLGTESEAIVWLEAEKNITKNLRIQDYKTPQRYSGIPGVTALSKLASLFGVTLPASLEGSVEAMLGANTLDGLVSLWHPSRD